MRAWRLGPHEPLDGLDHPNVGETVEENYRPQGEVEQAEAPKISRGEKRRRTGGCYPAPTAGGAVGICCEGEKGCNGRKTEAETRVLAQVLLRITLRRAKKVRIRIELVVSGCSYLIAALTCKITLRNSVYAITVTHSKLASSKKDWIIPCIVHSEEDLGLPIR